LDAPDGAPGYYSNRYVTGRRFCIDWLFAIGKSETDRDNAATCLCEPAAMAADSSVMRDVR
jgi:hypothetical protein